MGLRRIYFSPQRASRVRSGAASQEGAAPAPSFRLVGSAGPAIGSDPLDGLGVGGPSRHVEVVADARA